MRPQMNAKFICSFLVVISLWGIYLRADRWLTLAPSVAASETGTTRYAFNRTSKLAAAGEAAPELPSGETITHEQNAKPAYSSSLPFKGVVINSKYRTGSTYTSEFFNQHADVFFLYEPLGLVTLYEQMFTPTKVIKMAMDCDVPGLQQITPEAHWNWISYQLICALRQVPGCPSPKHPFAAGEETCRKAKYKATKVIRVEQIETIESMLYEGYKMVYILRDPRGMMNSRKDLHENLRDGEQGFDDMYREAREYCTNALMDFAYIANKAKGGDQVIAENVLVIRYEDLARNPTEGVDQIYNFLGIPADENVRNWAHAQEMRISGNVTLEKKAWEDPFDTDRDNPAEVADRWRGKTGLFWEKVHLIQLACREFMRVVGYLEMPSEKATKTPTDYPSDMPLNKELIYNYSLTH